MTEDHTIQASERVFERAAELFGLLSTPIRLRIISELCGGERHVSDLLESIEVSQSNMSQHLAMLYRSGVVARRRSGSQVFYRIADDTAVLVCRAVCTQIAIDIEGEDEAGPAGRASQEKV